MNKIEKHSIRNFLLCIFEMHGEQPKWTIHLFNMIYMLQNFCHAV